MTARPGDLVAYPLALCALAVLAINDHLLKSAFPGDLTGKLSDVAGLILVPFYLASAAEVLAWLAGRQWLVSTRGLVLLAIATGLGFAAVKITAQANLLYEQAVGGVRWALNLPLALAFGSPAGLPQPVVLVADSSDLLALPVLALVLLARRPSEMPTALSRDGEREGRP